jgi:nucleotide-binding universal stress UspA family protein
MKEHFMELPEVKIKKILYATDLSESAYHAFAYAVSLANHYQAKLTLLHVLDENPDLDSKIVGYIHVDTWNEIKQRHEEDARDILIGKARAGNRAAIGEALTHFCEDAQSSNPEACFETDDVLVKRGNAVDVILEQADVKGCDLIVMGTHGHGSIADAVMGSTARRVLKRAKLPVMVIRLPE